MRKRLSAAFTTWLLLLTCPTSALADGVQVTLRGSRVEQVSAGTTVLPADQLRPGHSSGEVEFQESGFAVGAADDRNLETYFARQSTSPILDVDLGSWRDQGTGYDFFLFEVGGNDAVRVRARFPDGSLGRPVALHGWSPTGYHPPSGANAGQEVQALAFSAAQLRDAAGQPLPAGVTLSGLRFESATFDVAAFLVHRVDPAARVDGDGSVQVTGTLRAGQLVELVYSGPWASETDIAPSPFRDARLSVTFTGPAGVTLRIPGFFDGDGDEGEWGTVWKVRFRPPAPGVWVARAEFRQGSDVAVDPSLPGTPGLLDGVTTTFAVGELDPSAPGFLGRGCLHATGEAYPRFATGEPFLEVGVNSPENLLAYRGFDGVVKSPQGAGNLHSFQPHVSDWKPGDPLFIGRDHGVDSKGLIGALNYLSDQGLNSVYALTMNLGGDGWDVSPFLGIAPTPFDRTHYDTSRLRQWEVVFEHAARRGILLHLVLGETETLNETWLDGGTFGAERRLYLRELVARFGHLPALTWNLCEENDFPVPMLREMADWIRALDPQGHPVTFHNHLGDFSDYDAVLGEARFEQTAFQYDPDTADTLLESWRAKSAQAGQSWILCAVEHSPWQTGVTDANHDELRKRILYDVLLSGGSLQWYAGWHDLPLGGDVSLEDFRSREAMWQDCAHALEFIRALPFARMVPDDQRVSQPNSIYGGPECFALPGERYAVYLPKAQPPAKLDLSGVGGTFLARWYDPRLGIWTGSAHLLQAGSKVTLPLPPHSPSEDWICLISRRTSLEADLQSLSSSAGGTQTLRLDLGPAQAGRPYRLLGSATGTSPGFSLGSVVVPLIFDRYTRWSIDNAGGAVLPDAVGTLPPSGRVDLHVVLAPGDMAPLIGQTLYHAVILTQPSVDTVTVAVPLQILP